MRNNFYCCLFLLSLITGSVSASGEERIALIITNQAYPAAVGPLQRTHLDGQLVAGALRKVGFKVTIASDANHNDMQKAISNYIARLSKAGPDTVGFFYYSGHGANQSKYGDNYMIPTEAPVTDGAQLPLLAIKLGDVIEAISATPAQANFIVIDACRNVPFTRSSKSASKGFKAERERSGVMIAYATDPGAIAVDENIYAKALAAEIPKAGRPAVLMFRAVRRAVLAASSGKQHPWTRDGLVNEVYFGGEPAVAEHQSRPPREAALTGPSETGTAASACTVIGRNIPRSIQLSVGMKFCDSGGLNSATVTRIGNRVVRFQDNGRPKSCKQGVLCGFYWPSRPMFRITAKHDPTAGIPTTATMLPR